MLAIRPQLISFSTFQHNPIQRVVKSYDRLHLFHLRFVDVCGRRTGANNRRKDHSPVCVRVWRGKSDFSPDIWFSPKMLRELSVKFGVDIYPFCRTESIRPRLIRIRIKMNVVFEFMGDTSSNSKFQISTGICVGQ